ncbi:MAG: hypothetical protein AAGJ94_05685 [Pseudomonadota bacterium]
MNPKDLASLRQDLPLAMDFDYFADRESAWLLSKLLPEDAKVGAIKKGHLARFLDRPTVKPVVAASGGVVRRADVAAVAQADSAWREALSPAATAGVMHAYGLPWHDFELSFTSWGDDEYWGQQMSRPGGNLVVQLGFPSDHAALMGKYFGTSDRKDFEATHHPIKTIGRPTLAWCRLDIEDGVALIEEVQSDWLRFVRDEVEYLTDCMPRDRELARLEMYEANLRTRYDKIWPKAMLLAVLGILVEVLGVKTVYMHRPKTGNILKHIGYETPPVSLYTQLPKSFGFSLSDDVPPFLARKRKKDIKKLQRGGEPLFWKHSF